MNAEEYWQAVTEKYPQFKTPESVVKLTARGLKNLIAQAHAEGYIEASKTIKNKESFNQLFPWIK